MSAAVAMLSKSTTTIMVTEIYFLSGKRMLGFLDQLRPSYFGFVTNFFYRKLDQKIHFLYRILIPPQTNWASCNLYSPFPIEKEVNPYSSSNQSMWTPLRNLVVVSRSSAGVYSEWNQK